MKFLLKWLDDRTGYVKIVDHALYENIPGGSRWQYVTGSMLVFAFVTQLVTGIFLWMCYSPGSQNAWESVYYIQHEMQGGWLLRGVHHVMAQAMVVLLPVHMLQVLWAGAYRKPREINYWLGLVLMLLTLGLSLTGYLLPWDQKGYWATKVATNLMSLAPGGEHLQKLVVGGSDYGHHTLTRFFALHAGVLPLLLVLFLGMHIAMFRRHGITAQRSEKRPDEYFWPKQVLKDAVACLALLAVVLVFTIGPTNFWGFLTGKVNPGDLGAELSAPADAAEEYSAARPEWYFLFLFQLLKKFKSEFFGAIVLPGVIMFLLFLLPFTGRVKFGHIVNVVFFIALLIGIGYLTGEALYQDNYALLFKHDPEKFKDDKEKQEAYDAPFVMSRDYRDSVERGEEEAKRVKELVKQKGIPRDGAVMLQRNDPETMGPRLFARNCASCHSYLDENGKGIAASTLSAPNLYGFATEEWFRRILDKDRIVSDEVFGKTKHIEGDMVGFISSDFQTAMKVESKKALFEPMVAALVAEAKLVSHREADAEAKKSGAIAKGKKAIVNTFECTGCHAFYDEPGGNGPELTGYGSAEWLKAFISNPSHEQFYADKNDRMPAFAEHPDAPEKNLLSDHDLDMLVRWLRGDDRHLGSR